jgi:hypothetical protein
MVIPPNFDLVARDQPGAWRGLPIHYFTGLSPALTA